VRNLAKTDAQIKADKKYRAKQEFLQARVSPEEKEAIIVHTRTTGESLNNFMRRAFSETIKRDKAFDKTKTD
jgi:predicted HicB family RNase H-like nuclease